MKRWPLVISFVLFIALCASLAYWAMQFLKPPARPVAAPPPSVQAPPDLQVAASLFGGKAAAVASNFQLKGVVASGTPADSVAIVSADGKPAQAVRANMEIAPGVKIKEVHRRYVVISDQGVEKRVELPEESTAQVDVEAGRAAPVATTRMSPRSAPAMPPAMVNNPAPAQVPPAAGNTANLPAPAMPSGVQGQPQGQPNTGMPASVPSAPATTGAPQAVNPAPQTGTSSNSANPAVAPSAAPPAPGMPVPAPAFPQGQPQ